MSVDRIAARNWLADEDGPTSVEYAVLLALILMVAMTAIRSLGGGAEGRWKQNGDKIRNAISPAAASAP